MLAASYDDAAFWIWIQEYTYDLRHLPTTLTESLRNVRIMRKNRACGYLSVDRCLASYKTEATFQGIPSVGTGNYCGNGEKGDSGKRLFAICRWEREKC